MATINTKYIRLAKDFEESYERGSETNKAEFLTVWTVIRKFKPKERTAVATEMKKAAESIKSDNARKAYHSVLNNCLVYTYVPDNKLNFTAIEWDTFKHTLRILKRINKYYKADDMQAMLDKIGNIWQSGMSPYRYNHLMTEALKQLGEDYPVPEKIEQLNYYKVSQEVQLLNKEDKLKLMAELMNELGYVESAQAA